MKTETYSGLASMGRMKKRRAVSELMGTLLMVGITLVAGFAIIGFVNGQAAASENQYAGSVAANVNYLKEHFVIVSIQFYNTGGANGACVVSSGQTWCNEVSISIYNNGAVYLNVKQIILKNIGTKSVSGANVPSLYLNSSSTSTVAYSGNPPTAGTKYGCSSVPTWATNIKNATAPPSIFVSTLPSCMGLTQGIMVGGSYQVTVIGAYGNVVNQQVTANG